MKRRRAKTNRFDFDGLDNEEQLMIQQAVKNSQRDQYRCQCEIPEAPTFRPTVEEFMDPLGYIAM